MMSYCSLLFSLLMKFACKPKSYYFPQLLFPGSQPCEENKPAVDQLTTISFSRSGASSAWHYRLSHSELSNFFHQINSNIVNGHFAMTLDAAFYLAALQAQVEWGEYDPEEEIDTDNHKLA